MPIKVPNDELVIAEGIVKAFGGRPGIHADYDRLTRDGVKAIAVKIAVDICEPDEHGFTYEKTYAYFDPNRYDIEKYGYIYTDEQFIEEVNKLIKVLGFKGKLGYTEMGMQGDDFVSLEGNNEYIEGMLEYVRSKKDENLSRINR